MVNSEWRTVSIDDIKASTRSAIAIGPFGSRLKADSYTDDGVPIIRGNNLTGTKYFTNDFVYVPEAKADELASSIVYADDLVFPHRGNIGTVGIVPSDKPRYLLSTSLMKLTVDKNIVDPTFLFYYFTSSKGKHELLKNASQAGTPGIATPLSSLKGIKFLLPPLKEQRRIAHILGTLDEKIELNHQLNATLENLARALFQSWFVDFDPVRAKASGEPAASICRRLNLTPELLALFPAELADSALGMVPAGWDVRAFSQIIELIGGGTPKTSVAEYWNGDIPWFSVVDAPSESDVFVIDTEKKISQAGLNNSSTRLLPKYTTIISARGTVGRLALTGYPMTMNQSCYGITGAARGPFFTYFATRQLVRTLKQSGHGTVFDTITRDTFSRVHLAVPSLELAKAFDKAVRSMLEAVLQNVEESRTLATLRDELLPKLLSGETLLN